MRYLSCVRLRLQRKTTERAVLDAFIAGMKAGAERVGPASSSPIPMRHMEGSLDGAGDNFSTTNKRR